MGIGKRITEVRGSMSRKAFAKTIGIVENTLRNYEEELSLPNSEVLSNICRELKVNPDWLLLEKDERQRLMDKGTEEKDNIFYVPKVEARLSAGTGSLETNAGIEEKLPFSQEWLEKKGNPNNMVIMRVSGDSMVPEIQDNDLVLIEQGNAQIQVGKIFAVGFEEAIYIKKIDLLPKKIVLSSSNKDYPPIYIDINNETLEQFRIIGKVIWVCREYR